MNTDPKSNFTCPSCNRSLRIDQQTPRFTLYCAWGDCGSYASNDGASGDTESDALENLKAMVDEENEK